jgi:pimeloyl-ACP methyl ester carboxylesterase
LLVVVAVVGCGRPAEPTGEPLARPAEQQTGERSWTTADGETMPYVVAGAGDVTVLLVHCWMCDRSFWDAQVPALAPRYRVIAIDLPGHGRASARRAAWSVSGYGEDVAGLIAALDLSNVVLVGHSMGGPVSLRAAALAPGRVLGVVAVDSLHDAEFDYSGERVEGFLQAFESDFAGTCRRFIGQMVPEEGADAVREHVTDVGCNAERGAIGIALLRNFSAIDMEAWFGAAGVPIRAINAAGGNPTKTETNRKYADFDAVVVDGVGHYLHMTRPETFNPLLLEQVAALAARARPA